MAKKNKSYKKFAERMKAQREAAERAGYKPEDNTVVEESMEKKHHEDPAVQRPSTTVPAATDAPSTSYFTLGNAINFISVAAVELSTLRSAITTRGREGFAIFAVGSAAAYGLALNNHYNFVAVGAILCGSTLASHGSSLGEFVVTGAVGAIFGGVGGAVLGVSVDAIVVASRFIASSIYNLTPSFPRKEISDYTSKLADYAVDAFKDISGFIQTFSSEHMIATGLISGPLFALLPVSAFAPTHLTISVFDLAKVCVKTAGTFAVLGFTHYTFMTFKNWITDNAFEAAANDGSKQTSDGLSYYADLLFDPASDIYTFIHNHPTAGGTLAGLSFAAAGAGVGTSVVGGAVAGIAIAFYEWCVPLTGDQHTNGASGI